MGLLAQVGRRSSFVPVVACALVVLAGSGCGKIGYDLEDLDDSNAIDAAGEDKGRPEDVRGRDAASDARREDAGKPDGRANDGADFGLSDAPGEADGAACTRIVNRGDTIQERKVAAALPAALGGSISEGTYYLVKREVYTGHGGSSGPTGHTHKETAELVTLPGDSGQPWRLLVRRVRNVDCSGDDHQTFIATPVLASPSRLEVDPYCGSAGSPSLSYIATPTGVVFLDFAELSVSTFAR